MSAINAITADKLLRLIGTAACPGLIDVRSAPEFAADSRLIPTAVHRPAERIDAWSGRLTHESVIVICGNGAHTSPGVAAWLRSAGIQAEILEGGTVAWEGAGLPCIPQAPLPDRDALERTVWVTRARPKVDRIACPWLIRRFVDPRAVFLYVAPSDVLRVADQFGAAPFDTDGDGVFWSHRGDRCTFDVMVETLGLAAFEALRRLAVIVRGADTGHLELAPESAGLLAASLGLSRIYSDDLEQLEAGMLLYDSFYRWCRDATDEIHNWASHVPAKSKGKR